MAAEKKQRKKPVRTKRVVKLMNIVRPKLDAEERKNLFKRKKEKTEMTMKNKSRILGNKMVNTIENSPIWYFFKNNERKVILDNLIQHLPKSTDQTQRSYDSANLRQYRVLKRGLRDTSIYSNRAVKLLIGSWNKKTYKKTKYKGLIRWLQKVKGKWDPRDRKELREVADLKQKAFIDKLWAK